MLVSVEGKEAVPQIDQFLRNNNLNVSSYHSPIGGLADKLDLSYSIPRTYLVSKGGKVRRTWYGEQPWNESDLTDRVMARAGLESR